MATGYTGTVHFTSSDSQASPPGQLHLHPRGQGTFTFSRHARDGGDAVDHGDRHGTSSLTGTESGIIVQAAAAKSLTVTGFPTSDTAGAAEMFTVTAYDAYGNVATGYTGTVQFTSSDPQAVLPASYTFTPTDEGKHTFSVTLETAGTQTLITATDTATSSLTARVGHRRPGRRGSVARGRRLSHQRHGGRGRNVTVTA